MLDNTSPIWFLHVIKTGGSTICAHLSRHMLGYYDIDIPELSTGGKEIFRSGHALVWRPDRRVITIVRDPADWLVSVYNHDMARSGQRISFATWYDRSAPNSVNTVGGLRDRMVKWASYMFRPPGGGLQGLIDMLSECWLVGVTERLNDDLPALCRYLNVPTRYRNERVTGEFDRFDGREIERRYELTAEMRTKIYRENASDMEFYMHARRVAKPWAEVLGG